ncbi:MAG: hypothetical protein GX275_06900 [Clostridiales bacterium]|nr:hypothetical protein [Clostridiales bacterium]
MNLLKKDGRVEEFNKNKIYTSIKNAASDISEAALNESDLNLVVNDVVELLEKIRIDGTKTSSYEVIGVIQEVLSKFGFNQVLHQYIVHK